MSTFAAIVVAAGDSVRMRKTGITVSKPLIPLCGVPVILHTLRTLATLSEVKQVVLVIRKEDEAEIRRWIEAEPFFSKVEITYGGASRQQSVRNGLSLLRSEIDVLMIHDGARPLVTEAELRAVMAAAEEKKAATLAVPVKDTIKMVSPAGDITATPDRSVLWAVHTPQVFEKNAYLAAMKRAEQEKKEYTDDCQLMENLGYTVWVVPGKYTNLKVTTAEDIPLAEAILQQRNEQVQEVVL